MTREVEVAIIGAGSAGLYAMSQIKRFTDNFVLIDGGELGTTCARVGCMPSKVLIQIAEDFHRKSIFDREGIEGGEHLSIPGFRDNRTGTGSNNNFISFNCLAIVSF